ncbi:hypothetical protein B0H11DRAFT_1914611 [Mycena galericulata]|nr:hypothetical protein B0H11DRAFT_1914611 [Mycena galericulata]
MPIKRNSLQDLRLLNKMKKKKQISFKHSRCLEQGFFLVYHQSSGSRGGGGKIIWQASRATEATTFLGLSASVVSVFHLTMSSFHSHVPHSNTDIWLNFPRILPDPDIKYMASPIELQAIYLPNGEFTPFFLHILEKVLANTPAEALRLSRNHPYNRLLEDHQVLLAQLTSLHNAYQTLVRSISAAFTISGRDFNVSSQRYATFPGPAWIGHPYNQTPVMAALPNWQVPVARSNRQAQAGSVSYSSLGGWAVLPTVASKLLAHLGRKMMLPSFILHSRASWNLRLAHWLRGLRPRLFLNARREESLKGGRDEENLGPETPNGSWDVYANFNNAGPWYNSAFGQQDTAEVLPGHRVGHCTGAGARVEKSEMSGMTKVDKCKKGLSCGSNCCVTRQGNRGGKWFTRRTIAFSYFALILILIIIRVPSFVLSNNTPLGNNATGEWKSPDPQSPLPTAEPFTATTIHASFSIPTGEKSLMTSILSAGTFFGALVASLINFLGTFSLALLFIGRLIGNGVGLISPIIILYIFEIAPKSVRGALVSGILLANCVIYVTQNRLSTGSYHIMQFRWSIMVSSSSPSRFLVRKGDIEKATKCLAQDEIIADLEFECQHIPDTGDVGSWLQCFKGSLFGGSSNIRCTIISTGLQCT